MSTTSIQLPSYHPNQETIRKRLNRFNVLDCGRRFGKDIFCRNVACEYLLEGWSVNWYEPEYKSLTENWSWMVDTLFPVTVSKSEQGKRIEIYGGGLIEFWSLDDPDASRGRKRKLAIINEAAKIPKLEYSWNAVIRATLIDMRGNAIFASTPKGRNFFWQLYRMGEDVLKRNWSCWKRSTYDNPFIDRSEVDEAKSTLPEIIFQQEYLAEFIDDNGGVFRRVQEAATSQAIDKPEPGRQYVAGVDVAASVDFTVITVMDVADKRMIYQDRFNRVDYNVLEDRLETTYRAFNLQSMTVESNSIGQPVIDHLYKKGLTIIPFTTTSATKQAIIQNLQSAFEHGEIKIINDPVTVGELLSFESKRNQAGGFSYGAPDGMHDDTVMSLAIAWNAITDGGWLAM